MDASIARRLAVALLAVAALAATAATIDTTVTGGTGGGLGGASGGAPAGAPAPLIDVPSGESAAVLGSVCVPFLARPPVVALLFALLAAGHYAVYRRSESLATVVATAVGVGFPLALLWAVLVSCRLPTLSIDVGFEFGLGADGLGIVPFPVGSGGFGLGGEGSGTVATPSALFGLALFVALALAVVLLLASTGDELAGDDDPADGDSEATPPDVRRVGEAAGDAADRLEAEADVGNEVYRAWVSPSRVICRSPIASRSAAWVFGGARLISSARTTFAKIGPSLNSKVPSRSSKTFVPVTSAGRRSGVNCTREKESPSAVATLRAVRVLPVPGTSSRRTCPRARTPSRTRSRKRSSAMTAFETSARTDSQAAVASSRSIPASGAARAYGVASGRPVAHADSTKSKPIKRVTALLVSGAEVA